jgi:uncharacterized membrane protein YfcA
MATHLYLLIFAVAMAAGAINSIAAGGALLVFPALLLIGLSPITANATTNTAMFFGTLASAGGYVEYIRPYRTIVIKLAALCLVGSVIGAVLLLTTPEGVFFKMVPFLILAAALLFTLGPRMVRIRNHDAALTLSTAAMIAQFGISIYGGYFGAGQGFAILALLILIGFRNMHAMNGIKTLIAACTNGIAVIPFMIAGVIAWPQAIVMCVGAALGGFVGARLAQKVDPAKVRLAVLALSYSLAGYFFWKAYLAPDA